MKLTFIKINLVLVLCLVLVACDHNDEKFYSIPKDEIYAEYYKCDPGIHFLQSFLIIENDNDLKESMKIYEKIYSLPNFNYILETYSLEYYTWFIGLVRIDSPVDSISQKALLIDKETSRVYTDCKYTYREEVEDITYWVFYWVVEKDKLINYDFTEQKKEAYTILKQEKE